MNFSELSQLDQAILATLSYHDLFDMPLTSTEIWRYLFREKDGVFAMEQLCLLPRVVVSFDGRTQRSSPTFAETNVALKQLVKKNILIFCWGYYAVPGRNATIEARQRRHASAQIKWRRLRIIAWFLQAIPFLEMVAASGSLAREMTREGSDLDVLLVTRPGRIWNVRFVTTVALDFFHLRRRPTGPTDNLICLNHYLAHDALSLSYQSLYTALEYARVVPLFGEKICAEFRLANKDWIGKYLVQLLSDKVSHHKTVRHSKTLHAIKRLGEVILGGRMGDSLEKWLGAQQKRRISKNEDANLSGGRVIASSRHLEFHPHSKEAPLIKQYNARIAQLGFAAFGDQKDSGLK